MPPNGTRWAIAGKGSNIPGFGLACTGLLIYLDGIDVTRFCRHAYEDTGLVEIVVPASDGRSYCHVGEIVTLELHGEVRISLDAPSDNILALARGLRDLIRRKRPDFIGRLRELDSSLGGRVQ